MTLILEATPELESRLQVLAARHGTSVEAVALQALESLTLQAPTLDAPTNPKPTDETQKPLSPRQRAALAGYGKYAGSATGKVFGSAELIHERRQEAAHEMQQEAERDNARSDRQVLAAQHAQNENHKAAT